MQPPLGVLLALHSLIHVLNTSHSDAELVVDKAKDNAVDTFRCHRALNYQGHRQSKTGQGDLSCNEHEQWPLWIKHLQG